MNLGVVTTGLKPLVIGSKKIFQLNATLDGIFWDLTGGVASLYLKDPAGNVSVIGASIVNGVAQASWTVTSPIGGWTRAWSATDSFGVTENGQVRVFDVVGYP